MRPFALCISLTFATCGVACAESTTIQGAGATFPAPLYASWLASYNKANPDGRIDYQPIGSGGGIKGITDRTVQFAGSDAPLSDEQLTAAPGLLHLPTVGGPVAMITSIPGLSAQLILDGPSIAGIYLGTITKWNSPQLVALNPGVTLPDSDIVVVHRSDGSGTSWIFTNYLTKVSPDWAKVGNATSVKWPTGLGGKGNAGVADAVVHSHGGIGYVEMAFATNAKLAVAKVVNKAGKAVAPSVAGVVDAAATSAPPGPDLRLSITDAPGEGSYPICGFTYLLVYQDLSYLKNPAQAAALVRFIRWCESDGQHQVTADYAALPAALQVLVQKRLATITCDGSPVTGETGGR